jgi:predicted phosphodiesterase
VFWYDPSGKKNITTMIKVLKKFILIQIFILYCYCDIIQYSPFEIDVKAKHPNLSEINRIKEMYSEKPDTLRFAFLTDIHENHDELKRAISSINKQKSLMFVVCGGDVTNGGLVQQYNWYVDIIKECRYPFLTIIGNHDYLANGKLIFEKIFGPTNYTLTIGDYKFIFFDDIIQENRSGSPKYHWLKIESSETAYNQIFIAHIPVWSEMINGIDQIVLSNLLKPDRVVLCLYGHNHCYVEENDYNCLRSIVADDIKGGEYLIVSLIGKEVIIERVKF